MTNPDQLAPGTQIAYVPQHANGDINHPDVEFGFVTSVYTASWGSTVIYARYWSKFSDGLRTTANSEGANLADIVLHESRSQDEVDEAMRVYCQEINE